MLFRSVNNCAKFYFVSIRPAVLQGARGVKPRPQLPLPLVGLEYDIHSIVNQQRFVSAPLSLSQSPGIAACIGIASGPKL